MTARTAGSEQITYSYGTTGTGAMRLVQETKGSMTKSYAYDTYGRTTTISHMGNNTTYSYTTDGLVSTISRPGSKTDTYTYDSYGNVSGMSAVSGGMMWSRTGYTGASSTSSLALQNGTYPFVRTTSLDSNGLPNAMSLTRNNSTLRGETYTFSPVTGNLTSRTVGNTTETFTYDVLDRLKKVQTGSQTTLEMTYGANGNILSKTGIGDYEYSTGSKPHAVTAVDNTAGLIPEHTQSVTYNAWGRVSEITYVSGGDTYQYTITYGPDLERWYTYFKKNGVTQNYTYYGVGYETCYHQEPGTTAYTLRTYYVNTPDGLSGIVRYDSRTGTYTPYAVETDHLGSITSLYNSSGTKVMGASFDAWGKRTQTISTLEFRRGFTGHEHIDGFDLINMNGRVYDPLIGRFLSPDMYVQLPGFSQSFNRYSYCLNNPLKYTDPSGEKLSWHSFFSYLLISPIVPPGTAEAFLSQSLGTASNAALAGAIAGAIKGANIWDEAMLKAKNSFLIDFGLFQVNENLPPSLNMLLLTSRFTGELRQTIDGNTIAHIRNVIDRVSDVSYSNGSTLVNISYSSNSSWGFTLGPYINSKNLEADLSSELIFRHEYGHTIQSALLGPGYINFVGIPSLIGEIFAKQNEDSFLKNPTVVNDHMKEWYETQANRFSDIYCESFGYSISDDNMTKRWDEQYYKDYRLSWFWFTFSPPLPFFWRIGYLR